jgi:hypothetical protein
MAYLCHSLKQTLNSVHETSSATTNTAPCTLTQSHAPNSTYHPLMIARSQMLIIWGFSFSENCVTWISEAQRLVQHWTAALLISR